MFILFFMVMSCVNVKLEQKEKAYGAAGIEGAAVINQASSIVQAIGVTNELKPIVNIAFLPLRWTVGVLNFGLKKLEENIVEDIEKRIEDENKRREAIKVNKEFIKAIENKDETVIFRILEDNRGNDKKEGHNYINLGKEIYLDEEKKEYTHYLQMLIEKGCCNKEMLVNIRGGFELKDSQERTPLMVAIECGNTNIVEYLIKNNYSMEKARKDGMKPIHVAISLGKMQVFDMYVKKREEGNSHESLIYQTNEVNGMMMNALAYACLHGQYDIAKRLLEEFKMESMEGYLLAGMLGRDNIVSLFNDKYKKEEDKKKLIGRIFDMGNRNNLLHMLPILKYMKKAQEEGKKEKYKGAFSYIKLGRKRSVIELVKELGVEEDLIQELILGSNGEGRTPLEHAILSNSVEEFKEMFEIINKIEYEIESIKEIKIRCLELSIETNNSEIYEYLKEVLKEEYKGKIEELNNKLVELGNRKLREVIKEYKNEIVYRLILEGTKGNKRKEETKARIREIEDIAIEEGNELALRVARELRNTDSSDLSYHVVNNEIEKIREDINKKDRRGVSYLSYACRFGNEEVVDLILSKNREIRKDYYKKNAMHEAIESNCINIIKKLPKEWIKERDENEENPLFRVNSLNTLNKVKDIFKEEYEELIKERNSKGQNILMKIIERYEEESEVKGKKEKLEELAKELMEEKELVIRIEKKREEGSHKGLVRLTSKAKEMITKETNVVVDKEGNNILHYIARYSEEGREIDCLSEEKFYKLSKQENRKGKRTREIAIEKDKYKMVEQMYDKHKEEKKKQKGEEMMLEALRQNKGRIVGLLEYKGISSEVRRGMRRRSNSMESGDNFDYEGVLDIGIERGSIRVLEGIWKYKAKFPGISEKIEKVLQEKISENNEEAFNFIMDKYITDKGLKGEEDKELIFKVMDNAIRDGKIRFIEEALKNEDIKKEIINYVYEGRYTLLILAALLKDEEVVKMLLEKELEVNKAQKDGWTALMIASQEGHEGIVKMLIEAKAEVDKAKNDGWTPLMIASQEGHEGIVKMLIEAKAEVDKAKNDGWTALMSASLNGHEKVVEILLEKGAEVDKAKNDGATALMSASLNGHEKVVEILLEKGAEVDKAKNGGATALMLASVNGHESIIKMLLETGANINYKNKVGTSALALSQIGGRKQIEELLLSKGADPEGGVSSIKFEDIQNLFKSEEEIDRLSQFIPRDMLERQQQMLLEGGEELFKKSIANKSPLAMLIMTNKKKEIEKMIKEGIDVNEEQNELGVTALMMASVNGHEEIVRMLIGNGAEVDKARETGATALMLASELGHESIVEMLLEKGAEVDKAKNDGWTPLMIASQEGHEGIVKMLIEAKAEVDKAKNDGWTALMSASLNGHEEIVRMLIGNGAEVDKAKNDGATALMSASLNGHEKVVEILLEKGAEVDKARETGATALMLASVNGHESIVEMLLEKGAEVDKAKNDGWTPLMIASQEGHEGIVKMLIEAKAEVDKAKNDGWTALMSASLNGHEKVVEILLEKGAEVDKAKNDGATALMSASLNGHEKVVEILLEKGAEVDKAKNGGATALMLASVNGHEEIVKMLLEKGAEVDKATNDGATALMVASECGSESIVKMLLEKGGRGR